MNTSLRLAQAAALARALLWGLAEFARLQGWRMRDRLRNPG